MGWEVENWRQKIHLNFRNFHVNLKQTETQDTQTFSLDVLKHTICNLYFMLFLFHHVVLEYKFQ